MRNETNETISDIVAWLRRPREGENAYLTLWREEIADRIEVSEKQSVTICNRFGNVAKMREALEFAKYEFCARGLFDASKQMEATLSAPPRNCDRPECATTKEAQDVWRQEDGGKTAYYEWLLATSTAKGEAK